MQRYDFFGEAGINEPWKPLVLEAAGGRYVLYADAEAAIAAAVEECGERSHGHYMDGQRDMLARCIAAVEGDDCECIDGADFGEHFSGIRLCGRCVALAALRALGGSDG